MNSAQEPEASLPLTPAVLHILLALADGERHGYGIMQEVAAQTDGQLQMGPGTLYGSLKRMLAAALIAESEPRPDPQQADVRRRYYHLTEHGRRALQAEIARLARVVQLPAAQRLLQPFQNATIQLRMEGGFPA
jgi:DNA-binding PadR family transcriptional regulator